MQNRAGGRLLNKLILPPFSAYRSMAVADFGPWRGARGGRSHRDSDDAIWSRRSHHRAFKLTGFSLGGDVPDTDRSAGSDPHPLQCNRNDKRGGETD